jgi:hypothetical protein
MLKWNTASVLVSRSAQDAHACIARWRDPLMARRITSGSHSPVTFALNSLLVCGLALYFNNAVVTAGLVRPIPT